MLSAVLFRALAGANRGRSCFLVLLCHRTWTRPAFAVCVINPSLASKNIHFSHILISATQRISSARALTVR